MVKGSAIVGSEVGLHARPAADFVRLASLSGHQVNIISRTGKKAVGTSILGVLSLGAKFGEELVIEVDGPDEASVLQALIAVVSAHKTV